jgi:hypothetical protein
MASIARGLFSVFVADICVFSTVMVSVGDIITNEHRGLNHSENSKRTIAPGELHFTPVYKGRIPQVGLDGITKKLFISILTI